MTVFKIKTGDENTYASFRDVSNKEILVDHLIQYDNQIKIGTPVFLLFGGDGTPWENGLAGICKVSSCPIDLGYEVAKNGKYFKLKLEVIIRLEKHLTKMDFSKYPETFDTGIGPSTKGERNQALGIIEDDKAIAALCRAIIDREPELKERIRSVFGDVIFNIANNNTIVYISPKENNSSYSTSYIKNFSQTIYYGVPGCGKSNQIDKKTKDLADDQKMRVVFHPEYTNADFVGQILPVQTADGIDYRFKAGPFARILKRALKNPFQPYYLIIEEINRGNAAAIFGDLFQLLDRKNDGWSSYSVENLDLNSFIRSDDDKYSDKEVKMSVPIGSLIFTENTSISFPPNLSILATMNTSDQNVFILDNAFQRRWDMVLVKNEFGKAETEEEQKNIDQQKTALIEGSKIKWETFQKTVNDKISQFSKENIFSSMIDKRLGCWFVKAVPDENDTDGNYIITEDSFKHKILKYLWDDAFKFSHEDIFEAADNFEALLEKVKISEPNFGIFKNIDFPADESEPPESEN